MQPPTVLIAAALVRQRRSAEAAQLLLRSGYSCEEAVHITRAAARSANPMDHHSSRTAWLKTRPMPMDDRPHHHHSSDSTRGAAISTHTNTTEQEAA